MKKWLQSSLVVSVVMLSACATNSDTTSIPTRPMKAPAKMVNLVPGYRSDAPNRYVVKRGDTLWGIASRFLNNPGYWKAIWHANPQIKNPNLIYPGDIISYVTVGGKRKLQIAGSNNPIRERHTGRKTADGRPVYNLTPTVQTEYIADPIPTLPKQIVYPFMVKNTILEPGFSEDYPYIIGQADRNYISVSGRSKVYAKTDDGSFTHTEYRIYREAKNIIDPISGGDLGVEAVYVGHLKMIEGANEDGIGTFMQTDAVGPVYPKDILIPDEEPAYGGELNFFPQLAQLHEDAVIVRPIGVTGSQTGTQFSTVLINVGAGEVRPGDVFKIVRGAKQTGQGRDGEAYNLPDYEVGTGIVYKTFDQSSFALVMNAYDMIYSGDRIVTP